MRLLAIWMGLCVLLLACLVYGVVGEEPALAAIGIALIPVLAVGGVRILLRREPEPEREALSAAFEPRPPERDEDEGTATSEGRPARWPGKRSRSGGSR